MRSASSGHGHSSELAQLLSVATLAIPALGIVVVDPLMGVVDTACIGRTSTELLTALAPNSAIFNLTFQVFTFIGVSVTNVLGRNSPLAPGISEAERRNRTTASQKLQASSLIAAGLCGCFCTALCFTFGPALLQVMGVQQDLLPAALQYLRIRSLASPAVMLMNASQGIFLSQQDTVTPLKIFLCAALINATLCVVLVLGLGLGLVGAAFATLAVQTGTAVIFLRSLAHHGASGKGIALVWAGFPSFKDLVPFYDVAWKLFTRTLFKMAAFGSITFVAMRLDLKSPAIHQVALQLFWLLSFFPEPLSMSAQSLIARDATDRQKVTSTCWLLVRMAGMMSVVLAALVATCFLFGVYVFTADQDIIDGVHDLVLPAMAGIVACTYVMQCDGIFIGSMDFAHLPRTNLFACMLTLYMLWTGELRGYGLIWIWWVMALFFAARLAQHALHALANYGTSAFGLYKQSC